MPSTLRTIRTLVGLYAVIAALALAYFLSRAGRPPGTLTEWANLALGSLALLAFVFTLGAARASAR